MKYSFRILFLLALTWSVLPKPVFGAVVFRPGEKAKYEAPGDEEISGSAQELFNVAQAAENKGDFKRAIKAYRALLRRHPKDMLAAGAAFRWAQLEEQIHEDAKAVLAYALLTEKFPKSDHFDEAIEGLFRIGERYLAGKRVKILGIPFKTSMDQAANIFAVIIRAAPYGKYTARAQFDIGRAREKQGANDQAIAAYQAVVEKFPNDPLAADAQYQIGYIWGQATRTGTYDPDAAKNAKTGFQDFLYRHPNSEKAAQAKENLKMVEHHQTSTSFQIAKYYDKQKLYRAAAIYYNDVIRQQPGSAEGDRAKKRIDELRAKVGDKGLQAPDLTAATADKKKKKTETANENSSAGTRPAPADAGSLPPADADASLPPPASLLPDTTTAPASSAIDSGAAAAPSATPENSPEASASPQQ